jgi:hypothetical protein
MEFHPVINDSFQNAGTITRMVERIHGSTDEVASLFIFFSIAKLA